MKSHRRPADREIPMTSGPEAELYRRMCVAEKSLDAAVAKPRPPPRRSLRTVRVFVAATQASGAATITIEGRMLEPAKRAIAEAPKFSVLLKSAAVEVSRDGGAREVVQWHKIPSEPDCDGFEIKQTATESLSLKILLNMAHDSDLHKMSSQLSTFLDIATETSSNVMISMWQYIKTRKLVDQEDNRYINCDASLSSVLGVSRLMFPQLPELLANHYLPIDPVIINYSVRFDKEYDVNTQAYDIKIMYEEKAVSAAGSLLPSPAILREIQIIDEKIGAIVRTIQQNLKKKEALEMFCRDPVGFVNGWVESQKRDLGGLLDGSEFDGNLPGFFERPAVQEAVFHYLAQRS